MSRLGKQERFVKTILEWFNGNKRTFPWRGETDPYRILIVELLLRKTTAKQVSDIYDSFFKAFPSLQELAKVRKSEIAEAIRPLGLQNQRAESLHKIAITLAASGEIPKEEHELLALPGVGQYCADAVRCFAFGKEIPIVDRNVIRIIDRVFATLPPHMSHLGEAAAKAVRDFIQESSLPQGSPRSFNLALLDFAAEICKAKNPQCSVCPLDDLCTFYHTQFQA